MMTFLRVKSLTFGVQANLASFTRFLTVSLVLFFAMSLTSFSQTTYTWIGGNGAWNVAGNWSPAIVPPSSNTATIIEFSDGGNYTVTAVPSTVVRELRVINNTNVTLQAATTNTLSLTTTAAGTNFIIGAGSTLSNTATNVLTIATSSSAGQIYDISGTLNWNGGTFTVPSSTTSFTTVSSTGVINHFAGTITAGSAARLVFDDGATYHRKGTSPTSHAIPTATWHANSHVFVEELQTVGTLGGVSGQSFGNFTYNCTSQNNVAISFAITGVATTFKGDFNLSSTGSNGGTLNFKSGTAAATVTINQGFNISDGLLNANVGGTAALTLNCNGGYNQTGGTFNLSSAAVACTMNIGGDYVLAGGTFTQSSTTVSTINFTNTSGGTYSASGTLNNTNLNYQVITGGILTLQSQLDIAASRALTISGGSVGSAGTLNLNGNNVLFANGGSCTVNNFGTLNCGDNAAIANTTGATTFSLNSGATLMIGSPQGITATGGGANGNIQVSSTRTYNIGAHYIYTGTTGQVTGNGVSASVTGSITVNLSDGGALQISNSPASLTIGVGGRLRMVNGNLSNTARFANSATATLEYAGTISQTTSDNEFPNTDPPRTLIINNPSGVTLHAPRAVLSGSLTLIDGILYTTSTNLLTITNTTASTGVVGGSITSYVNGPLARNLNGASASNVFNFPVGKSSFANFSFSNGTAGTTTYVVEYFDTPPSAGVGVGLSAVGNSYWRLQRTSGTVDILSSTVTLQETGIVATSRVGFSPNNVTSFLNRGGTGPAATISSLPMNITGDAYYTVATTGTLSGIQTGYVTLTSIAEALQTMLVTGDVIFELPSTYLATHEPSYPVMFNEFATDGNPWAVTIRPEAGSTNFLTAGDPATANPLIDFNGVDRLTIDGRAGGAGNGIWTFRNTRTVATVGPTFRFINDATFNGLEYLQIEGQNIATTSGTILFSTASSVGNSDNTISNCHIRENTVTGTLPTNAIYSAGTISFSNARNQILDNNIYNFFLLGAATIHSGVNINSNNTAWVIEGNSFYQTASRTFTAGVTHYIININNTGTDYVIRANYIGGSQALAGGTAYTATGTAQNGNIAAIYFNPNTAATGCVIENNVISNISWSKGGASSGVNFIGIRNANGNTLIKNNTIGSGTGTGSITITENFVTTPGTSNGIYVDAGNCTIEDNTIGAITVATSVANIGHNFYGILLSGGGSIIQNNVIGSLSTANSINASTASTNTNGQFVVGIQANSAVTTNITGNTIANLNNLNASTNAAGVMRGIATNSTTGIVNITNNTIYNLVTASPATGSGATFGNIGILHQRTTAGQTISNNTIYGLKNTNPSSVIHVVGISYSGPTTGTNLVSRNNIHSLSVASSNANCSIIGINIISGIASFHNNMIRLGVDDSGADITTGYIINGMAHASPTAGNNFYYNTVYIGGNGILGGANNTHALIRTNGTVAMNVRNKILVNTRSNNTSTGGHYGLGMPNSLTGLASNNNIFYTPGLGGETVLNVTTPQNLAAWKGVGYDLLSYVENIPFINATGNASNVNLHLSAAASTQAESNGFAVAGGPYGDFDGQPRFGEVGYNGTGTAPDIGADENDFTALDVTPPAINYTPIANQITMLAPSLSATITDAGGVASGAGAAPRIYFKKIGNANTFVDNTNATNGWKYVESLTGNSPFSFNINYTLIFGGIAAGDTIQYFVVAQDIATTPNVNINSGILTNAPASSVALVGNFPITGSINSYRINILSGTVSVGAGQAYTSLTNNGGLFEAINNAALSGNLVAEITSDLTIESGTHGLNQWNEFAGSGFTLTIKPNAAVDRTISGGFTGALFRLNGADRVIIDGSYGGTGKHLIFSNTNVAATSTVQFINEATNDTIRNCKLRGSSTSTSMGVVMFSTSSAGTLGNSNNMVTNCDIHQNAAALPTNGIYSLGTTGRINNNNSIINNNIYNFYNASSISTGILLEGFTSNWTISGNKFYQEAPRTLPGVVCKVIHVNNTNGNGFNITDNYIGGSASDGSGTMAYTSGTTALMAAIQLNVGSASPSIVENNIIRDISFTTTSGSSGNQGVFSGIYHVVGSARILNNTIGASTGTGSINITVNTNNGGVINGIKCDASGATVKIQNNTIGSITANGTGTNNGVSLYGIHFIAGNVAAKNNNIGSTATPNSMQVICTATSNPSAVAGIVGSTSTGQLDSLINNNITNLTNANTGSGVRVAGILASGGNLYIVRGNQISHLSAASSSTGSGTSSAVVGISLVTGNTLSGSVDNNVIYDLGNTNTGTANVSVTGIAYNGGTSSSNTMSGNFIHSLHNAGTSTTAPFAQIYGINVVSGAGPATLANNMVRLGIISDGSPISNHVNIVAMEDGSTTAQNFYNNTLYVGGSTSGVTNISTYAMRRSAVSGADIIQNNIFANDRTGGTGPTSYHMAFGNVNATGLSATNFDYNIFYSRDNEEATITGTPFAGSNSALRMQALRAATPANNNLHSGFATLSQINFMDADGDASTVNLRLNNANSASGAGLQIVSITTDFDGMITRANPPSIGAHESASFDPLNATYDIYTPNFSFTNIPTQTAACIPSPPINIDVTIADVGTGVQTSPGNEPHMWWRLSSGAYAPVAGVLQSGNANNGVWRFTINPTLTAGETYHYYFVAEDQAAVSNRWYSSFNATTPVHPDVATQTIALASPSTFIVSSVLPLSGTVTVGSGGTYTTLTGAGGLFNTIITNGLSGDLRVEIISNTTENGSFSLNNWVEYCGSGYRVKIVPSSASLKTLSGSLLGMGLFGIYAPRVTIDGSFAGNGRYLRFENTYASSGGSENSVFRFGSGTSLVSTDTLRNCEVVGNTTRPAGAVVHMHNISGVVIHNNILRGGASYALNIVRSDGASNITLSNNELYNFLGWSGATATAIWANTGTGSNWNIVGNSIYNTVINGQGPERGIYFNAGGGSNGNIINGNFIGGSAPQCGGTNFWRSNYASDMIPLYVNVGSGDSTVISGNKISRIEMQTGDGAGISTVWLQNGRINFTNNMVGDTVLVNQILVGGQPSLSNLSGWVYGIDCRSSSLVKIENNYIGGLTSAGSFRSYVNAVEHTGSGTVNITGNYIGRCYNGANDQWSTGYNTKGIVISAGNNHNISRNIIYQLGNAGSPTTSQSVDGIQFTGTSSGDISGNILVDFFHTNNGGNSSGIILAGTGSRNVYNNTITMANRGWLATYTTRKEVYGIMDYTTGAGTQTVSYNTIYITGNQAGVSGIHYPSAGFYRLPNGTGTGSGSNVVLRNNLIINDRTGSPTAFSLHYCIDNTSSSPSVGWSSDYNFFAGANANTLGYWHGAGDRNFTQWLTSSNGDASSWNVNTTMGASSATQLNPSDLFINTAIGDLRVNTASQTSWFLNGKAVAVNISTDLRDDPRTTTYGYGTDIGADEFTPDNGILPHDIIATPSLGGGNNFTFAGRTIGSITWGNVGTVPTEITARYYSGDAPGTNPSPAYAGANKTDFMTEFIPTGGTGYSYNAVLNYDAALAGSYANNEGNMEMIKTLSNAWIDVTSAVDTINNTLSTSSALSSFSFFSGGESPTPLPIELLSFSANCAGDNVKLNWSTATEINNQEFIIHRSVDLMAWEEILRKPGAGNSNQIRNYQATDDRPVNGLAYYRLTQRDYDGTAESFAPVSADCYSDGSGNTMSVYPNPATDNFRVSITLAEAIANATIIITDVNGKNIAQRNVNLAEGTTELSFDAQGMNMGTYIVHLKSADIIIKPVKLVIK